MTEIQNPKQKKQSLTRRKRLRCALNRFGIWYLEFIWNFVLGICDFSEVSKANAFDFGAAERRRVSLGNISHLACQNRQDYDKARFILGCMSGIPYDFN
jgi:hypothetical protein